MSNKKEMYVKIFVQANEIQFNARTSHIYVTVNISSELKIKKIVKV